MTSMVAGDVARMAAWKVHGVTPAAIYTLSFKAPKDRVGVFLLLGDEAKDGTESLDVEKRLNELGWFGVISMSIFLLILVVGFVYEWKKGALEWE